MTPLQLVETEARAAREAPAALSDEPSQRRWPRAALADERREHLLRANAADLEAAQDRLDAGALDRLRLDERRRRALADQVASMAALQPLELEESSWTLAERPPRQRAARSRSASSARPSRRARTWRSTSPASS